MLRVGLTGSIAVGKSFVAATLAELGCRVLDADAVARAVVEPGQSGLEAIVGAFGREVLTREGRLDRARVGAIIFADDERRRLLNSLLHPLIIAAQDEQLRAWEREDAGGVAVVDAALMIESGSFRRFDKLIVVHCDAEAQVERLMKRNGLTRAEAEARINAQMPQEEKMRHADYLIDTSGSFAESRRRTEEVYNSLKSLAAEAPA